MKSNSFVFEVELMLKNERKKLIDRINYLEYLERRGTISYAEIAEKTKAKIRLAELDYRK